MSVTFGQNVTEMEKAFAKVRYGAAGTATAMARFISERTSMVTLRRTHHASGAWHRTPPGQPPAYSTGKLARGMYFKPASVGLRTSALVGNNVDYSRILEFGCVIYPVNKKFMHWTDSGGSWYHEFLVVPPHPFLSRTTEDSIRDGSLRDVAIKEFRKYDP